MALMLHCSNEFRMEFCSFRFKFDVMVPRKGIISISFFGAVKYTCFETLRLFKKPSKHSSWWWRLEDVMKMSFVFVFRRRLQDVLVKTNIFVFAIRLQDVFKTFSRRLQDVLQKRLQDIFKTSCKDVFKTFSRRIIKLNCLPRSRIYLVHTSDKFLVSLENLQVWWKFIKF